jgi:hypothetical protein
MKIADILPGFIGPRMTELVHLQQTVYTKTKWGCPQLRTFKKLLTKISSWCLSKTKREKNVGRRSNEEKKKTWKKTVGLYFDQKSSIKKTRKQKNNSPKTTYIRPCVLGSKYFTVCTKKTVKNYQQSTACLEDISSSKKTKLFLGPPAKKHSSRSKIF